MVENIEIGGIRIPIHSGLGNISQTHEFLKDGKVTHRMMNGNAVKQTHFNKIRTTINGEGTLPPGIQGIDYKDSQLLKFASFELIYGAHSTVNPTRMIAIPAERRSDEGYEPRTYGLVDYEWRPTTHTIAGGTDIVDIDELPGAVQYYVLYYPEIQVFSDGPSTNVDIYGKVYSWSIEAEQI